MILQLPLSFAYIQDGAVLVYRNCMEYNKSVVAGYTYFPRAAHIAKGIGTATSRMGGVFARSYAFLQWWRYRLLSPCYRAKFSKVHLLGLLSCRQ